MSMTGQDRTGHDVSCRDVAWERDLVGGAGDAGCIETGLGLE